MRLLKTLDRRARRGVILPFAAALMVAILGFVAFAVDIGYIKLSHAELQAAADAAAMAGVLAVPDGPEAVVTLAQMGAEENHAAGSLITTIPAEDIELGRWNKESRTFLPLRGQSRVDANSVRVQCRCVTTRNTDVPTFFAKIFGRHSVDVVATAIARRGLKCGGLIGIDSARLNGKGAYTDSYDSSAGPYQRQTPRSSGHICSNGPINVQNGQVNGNATPGYGHSVRVGSQGYVSGSTTSRETPLVLAPVAFGDIATNNDNDRLATPPYNPAKMSFKHTGGGLFLPAGNYYFTDMDVTGGPIIVAGGVSIYVQGDVSITGESIVNVTARPANLKIYAEGKSVKIAGRADFVGVVYAPESDVRIGGTSSFFGGAVGKTLRLHNTGGVHADEALSFLREFPARAVLVD